MAELYIGNNQIGGGSADLSGYVDVSTFDDVTHTTAAALVNLKILHNEQDYKLDALSRKDTALTTDISTLNSALSSKADVSAIYTKTQIDNDSLVVAAALASLDSRVSSIESSVGDGSGSGGGEVDLSVINASVNNIENDYVKSEDIANFITADYTYDKSHIDASFIEVADMIPTVPTAISSFTNDTGFITDNDTSVYALKSEVPTVPTAISSFTNDTGFITDNDTSIYALKSEVDSSFGETYLVKITNSEGYYCYIPRTMSDADKEIVLSKLTKNGGIVKTVLSNSPNGFIGTNSNAEGSLCIASGNYSHAEGAISNATGYASHAEGYDTTASGGQSHAEGRATSASGGFSHAEGYYTSAKELHQHAEGQYNLDASTAILIVGNGTGTATSSRHNAFEVHLSGDVKISDTYAAGEAQEKPMYVLQEYLHSMDTSINNINASVNYISVMQQAVLSDVNFVVMQEIDYELITPDPSIIYFLT